MEKQDQSAGKHQATTAQEKGGFTQERQERLRHNIPAALRNSHFWLCFKYESSADLKGFKKLPIGEWGDPTDYRCQATWLSFEQALAACGRWKLDGLGFALMASGDVVVVDLHNCRDPRGGEIEGWAQQIISELGSYAEVLLDDEAGVRVFVGGKWEHEAHRVSRLGPRKKGYMEIYAQRFFVLGGDHLDGTPPEMYEAAEVIAGLHSRFFKDDTENRKRKELKRQFRRATYGSFRERDRAAREDRSSLVSLLELVETLGEPTVSDEQPLEAQTETVIDVTGRVVDESSS
jgi:primase-polymerase (primpol)-like protein